MYYAYKFRKSSLCLGKVHFPNQFSESALCLAKVHFVSRQGHCLKSHIPCNIYAVLETTVSWENSYTGKTWIGEYHALSKTVPVGRYVAGEIHHQGAM